MAVFVATDIITDPDDLSATVKLTTETRAAADEIFIDTTPAGTPADPRTIAVVIDAGNNGMKEAGLTLKCLYSFLKEEWRTNADLIKFPFPMTPITDEQFEFTQGWNLEATTTSGTGNDGSGVTTPYLIRTGGWAVNNARAGYAGTVRDSERWFGAITLGALDLNDQVYYRQINDNTTAPTDAFLEGTVNQAIQFYRNDNPDTDGDTGDASEFDYTNFFEIFIRTFGKTYTQTNLDDIGAGDGVTYQAYRFPLANATDPKVTQSEAAASGDSITISNIDGDATTITVDTTGNHGLAVNDTIDIFGTTNYNANGFIVATITDANTFTIANTGFDQAAETSGSVAGQFFRNMSLSWANTTVSTQQTGFNDTFDSTGVSVPEAYFTVNLDADVAGNLSTKASAEYIYMWTQAQLRKATDTNVNTSDTGVRRGDITPVKLRFVGDDLFTIGKKDVPGSVDYEGVYITDFATGDQNRLHFYGYGSEQNAAATISSAARATNVVTVTTSADHGFIAGDYITIANTDATTNSFNGSFEIASAPTTTTFTFAQTGADESATVTGSSVAEPAEFQNLTFPFVSTLTLNFNPNLTGDTDAIFRVFFTNDDAGDNTGRDFGTKDALLVKDTAPADISGTVSASSLQFSYAYDSNVQRGNDSAGVDAPITVVAIGLNDAQYVSAAATIQRSDLAVSLVAPLERNYANPV
ncbi:hypothetical protein OAF54_02230 [bacterium]|nr:hypothetical protein [bacterium]